jgi:RND superfamily putative drug exporter
VRRRKVDTIDSCPRPGLAVLLDATLIRGVLLPAAMKLLGDWNWYLPGWLEWIPRFNIEPELHEEPRRPERRERRPAPAIE